MEISEEIFAAANRHGGAAKTAFPAAVAVRYDRRTARLVISLSSGIDISFSPNQAQGLEVAQPGDFADAQISPSGLGVHFPKLDADIFIPALLEGFLGSRRWMAAQNGRAGGKASSEAKSVAARTNGMRGGRPKKTVPVAVEG
jgi:hypothetical protein